MLDIKYAMLPVSFSIDKFSQIQKKMCLVRSVKYERQSRTAVGHCQRVEYIATMTI